MSKHKVKHHRKSDTNTGNRDHIRTTALEDGIKDEPQRDRSFGLKWHNMAEPAMNERHCPICGNVNGPKVFQHYELMLILNI